MPAPMHSRPRGGVAPFPRGRAGVAPPRKRPRRPAFPAAGRVSGAKARRSARGARPPRRKRPPATATIEARDTLRLGDVEIGYVLKRMPRRRHVHILVNGEGIVEVRAPWRFGRRRARETLRGNAEWVLHTLERTHRRISRRPRLVDGARLPLLDRSLRLDLRPRAQRDLFDSGGPRRGLVERRGEVLRVSATSLGEGELRALIEGWYRREAAAHLAARVEHYAPLLGVRPSKMTIRGQHSRWGSCSVTGALSLNWRLMMAPEALADYVVVHELCHLRHMDHSPRFWAMVGGLMPDYRLRRKRLNALQEHLPL